MKSSISRSAAWPIRPDLDASWHTISEWAIGPPADLTALLAPAGLAHALSVATSAGEGKRALLLPMLRASRAKLLDPRLTQRIASALFAEVGIALVVGVL